MHARAQEKPPRTRITRRRHLRRDVAVRLAQGGHGGDQERACAADDEGVEEGGLFVRVVLLGEGLARVRGKSEEGK